MKILTVIFTFSLFAGVCLKQDFSQRVTNFSFELLYFTGLQTDQHTVISPFGVWTLMAAVAQGTDGRSYDQLRRALNLPKARKELFNGYKLLSSEVHSKAKGVALLEKNYMFTERTFRVNQEFRNTLRTTFNTIVSSLDFTNGQESSASANNLISQATNGQIKEALTPSDFDDAQIILTNVIHFKGLWKLPFNETDTKVEPFYDERGQQIGTVNMMYQRAQHPFTNMKSLGAYALEVPYGEDNRFSMLLILPYADVHLWKMIEKFTMETLGEIFQSLDKDQELFGEEEVDFSLPRFKISTNLVLNKPLNDMGVYDIFDPALASFGPLSDSAVFVSRVVHKADIEVTESGTIASAVSSSVISNRNPPIEFKVNRPFMYMVIEKMSSTVIFSGVYSKPSVF